MLVIVSSSAAAATPRDGDSSAGDARLRMLLQQATAQVSQLQSKNASLESELQQVQDQLDELKKDKASVDNSLKSKQREAATLARKGEQYQEQNQMLRTRLTELADQYRELADGLKVSEERRAELRSLARDYDLRVVACEKNNESLYTISMELIEKYENKGMFTSLLQREPLTKLKRVQIENMLDEYAYLVEQMRINYPKDMQAEPVTDEAAASE